VSKTYQKTAVSASAEVIVPAEVTISLGEVVESAKEGLLALAVGTGLTVMEAMFAADTERLCGPKGKHNEQRAGYRHGTSAGAVTLGGRRLSVQRPRIRAADRGEELPLPSYSLFSFKRGARPSCHGAPPRRAFHPPLSGRSGAGR